MQKGIDFLRAQLDDAIGNHRALLTAMSEHDGEADDQRYSDLCERHLPRMRDHQVMLEEFRSTLGVVPQTISPTEVAGAIRKVAGSAFGMAKSLADAPQSDYLRLASDLDLARRLEVTFKTFRDAGREMRITGLAQLGETAERHHDDYSADAKRLLLQMFVERADGAAAVVRTTADSRADSRFS